MIDSALPTSARCGEYDFFISYSRQDQQTVIPLAEALRDIGAKIWLDKWEIHPGDDIYLSIEHGLEASKCLVLMMSPNTFSSDWINLERSTIMFRDPNNRERRFIPLLLQTCQPPSALSRLQYIDGRGIEAEEIAAALIKCATRT